MEEWCMQIFSLSWSWEPTFIRRLFISWQALLEHVLVPSSINIEALIVYDFSQTATYFLFPMEEWCLKIFSRSWSWGQHLSENFDIFATDVHWQNIYLDFECQQFINLEQSKAFVVGTLHIWRASEEFGWYLPNVVEQQKDSQRQRCQH